MCKSKLKSSPFISVCIPVYKTEPYLMQCLLSVASQNFQNMEILVLNDASPGYDAEGHNSKKIVKEFTRSLDKKQNIIVRYLENSRNLVLVESRRRLVSEAHGDYIFMLDSDDFLPENALALLYESAIDNQADVVQGNSISVDATGINHIQSKNEAHAFPGIIEDRDVFDDCFCNKKYRPFIPTKLIRREIYLKAFEQIPFMKTHMAEEVLQYFFIALFAKKYVGIDVPVYFYRHNTGITTKTIDSLSEWRTVCSTASVFTAIYSWIEESDNKSDSPMMDKVRMKSLQQLAKFYCINNVKQLRAKVIPELQEQAHEMLCQYWGEEAIKNTEEFLSKKYDC